MPRLSVIINNYNYGRFLRQCIDSVLNQTVPADEVIVVDDGSTDESREVMESYGDRIVAVFKENGGQASAMNAGYAVSSGDWVWFVDADDWLDREAIAWAVMDMEPRVTRMEFRLFKVAADGKFLGHECGSRAQSPEFIPLGCFAAGGFFDAVPTSGNVYRRTFLDSIMPIPEETYRISADLYLTYANLRAQHVKMSQRVAGYYRIHGKNQFHQATQFITDKQILQRRVLACWQICDLVYPQMSAVAGKENRVETFLLARLPYNGLKQLLLWERISGHRYRRLNRQEIEGALRRHLLDRPIGWERLKESILIVLLRYAPLKVFLLFDWMERRMKRLRVVGNGIRKENEVSPCE